MNNGRLIEQEPKSRAGRRTVAFPREIVGELRWHLECFAEPGRDCLVFVGPKGGRLRRSNFRDLWLVALKAAGISDRDEAIAAAMGTALTAARKGSRRSPSGTWRARG